MARIRTIKPEALQHRKVGKLTDRAFRVWVGLITQADDEGRLPCEADQVAAWIFGYQRQVKTEQVEEAIQEIAATEMICLYNVNGTRYAYFPSWKDHQRINRPQRSNLPDPSLIIHGTFNENSMNDHGSFTGEGSGREWNGKERIKDDGGEFPPTSKPTAGSGIFFRCAGKTKEWEVPKEMIEELCRLFPGVDVKKEIELAKWKIDNGAVSIKTASGMPKFLSAWMGRVQNQSKGEKPKTNFRRESPGPPQYEGIKEGMLTGDDFPKR